MISAAREAVPRASFIHASIYDLKIPPCEAAVALGEVLNYHAEGADADALLRGFFEKVAAVLPGGGMLIFDVIETAGPSLAGKTWASGDGWAVLVEAGESPPSRILTRSIETFRRTGGLYRRSREVHAVRLFSAAALPDMLAACGFKVETAKCYGSQQLLPRRRVLFCARL